MNNIALSLTFIMGLIILIGGLVGLYYKKNEKVLEVFTSIALGVVMPLALLEMIPYSLELTESPLLSFIFFLVGIVIVLVINSFSKEEQACLDGVCTIKGVQFGIILLLSMFIHDFLEGASLYLVTSTNPLLGVPFLIGVTFHNLPMGLILGLSLYNYFKSRRKTIKLISVVAIAPFLGGLLIHFNRALIENTVVTGLLISISSGMLFALAIFELLQDFIKFSKKSKYLYLALGIVLFIFSKIV